MNIALFHAVRKIVSEQDPIGIIFDDDNPDEYDAEVTDILPLLDQNYSVEELSKKIREIFVRWFGEQIASKYENYEQLAKKFLAIPRDF